MPLVYRKRNRGTKSGKKEPQDISDKARAQLQGKNAKKRLSRRQGVFNSKEQAALMGLSARELMTRDMQESRKLLDSKTEEALKGALRQVEERSRL